MSWHLTWQDPVAWIAVIAVVVAVWKLQGARSQTGCGSCGDGAEADPTGRVDVSQTRLGRRADDLRG